MAIKMSVGIVKSIVMSVVVVMLGDRGGDDCEGGDSDGVVGDGDGDGVGVRFKPTMVKEMMQRVLEAKLEGSTYHQDHTPNWTREIADEIKASLKSRAIPILIPHPHPHPHLHPHPHPHPHPHSPSHRSQKCIWIDISS